jgi:hypothetical protein
LSVAKDPVPAEGEQQKAMRHPELDSGSKKLKLFLNLKFICLQKPTNRDLTALDNTKKQCYNFEY